MGNQLRRTSLVLAVHLIHERSGQYSISAEIQFLSSPFLFEKALGKLNLKVSAYAEGKILTEDLYNKSSFKINLLQITDSTILDKPIFIKSIEGSTIVLEYLNGNKKTKIFIYQLFFNIFLAFF